MPWNTYSAITWARQHAHHQSKHRCAHYVSEAIRHGGINIPNTHFARDLGQTLTSAGFHEVYGEPIAGDIAVIQPVSDAHSEGHACIYDGQGTWYSDFIQHEMYPGPLYRTVRPSFKIYRH